MTDNPQSNPLATELERLHRKVDSAMRPFSLMLGSRRYSPTALREVAVELAKASQEIIEFVDGQKTKNTKKEM